MSAALRKITAAALIAAVLWGNAEAASNALPARDAAPPVSDEEAVRNGDWPALVLRYENKYAGRNGEGPLISRETLREWFRRMGSDTMTSLIMRALENNRDFASARAKVAEARAALGTSRAAGRPKLDGAAGWTYSNPSDNVGNPSSNLTRLGMDASWEIDIFGGRRYQTEAAGANLESAHAALHSAWVTMASEVALNYVSFCTLQKRLEIAERNLALQEDTLSLLTSQYKAGLRDSLAVNQTRYTAEQTRASIPQIRAGMESALNSLAILTGDVPGILEGFLSEAHELPRFADGGVFTGIPADAVRQRPDVRAAERALSAAIALRKSAKRDLLPKFSLAGSIGLETLSAGNLLSGGSLGFSFGPSVTIPIFNGEAIRKNIQIQTAREEQALAAYENTVLAAVAEVRDALAAGAQEAERNKALREGAGAARAALETANDKYMNGIVDFSNVIGATAALLSLEDALAVSGGQMTGNAIRVFKALGGGWGPLEDENLEDSEGGAK